MNYLISLKCQCYWNLSSKIRGDSGEFCHFKWLCHQCAENKPSFSLGGVGSDWIRHIFYGAALLSIWRSVTVNTVCFMCLGCVTHSCCSPQIQGRFAVCLPWSQCLLLSFNWGCLRWSLASSAFLQLFSMHSNDRAREEKVNLQTFHQSLKPAPKLKMQCFTIRNGYCRTPSFRVSLLLEMCVGQWIPWLTDSSAQIRRLKFENGLMAIL